MAEPTGMKAYYIHEIYRALTVLARNSGACFLEPESWRKRKAQLCRLKVADLESIAGELQKEAGTAV